MDVFHLIEMNEVCTKGDKSAIVTKYTWDPIIGHRVTWKFDDDLSHQAVLIDLADFAELIDDLPIDIIECDRFKCIIYVDETKLTRKISEYTRDLQQINDDEGLSFNFFCSMNSICVI